MQEALIVLRENGRQHELAVEARVEEQAAARPARHHGRRSLSRLRRPGRASLASVSQATRALMDASTP